MVGNQFIRNPQSSNNMVEEKQDCSGCGFIKHGDIFSPFSEIFNDHNNILMVISIWRSKLHKFNGPSTERVGGNDKMKGRRWSSSLRRNIVGNWHSL